MFRSFADQLKGFVDRPHDAIPRQPVDSPAAWRAQDLREREWRFGLSEPLVQSLGDAVDRAMSHKLPMSAVNAENVPVAHLQAAVSQ